MIHIKNKTNAFNPTEVCKTRPMFMSCQTSPVLMESLDPAASPWWHIEYHRGGFTTCTTDMYTERKSWIPMFMKRHQRALDNDVFIVVYQTLLKLQMDMNRVLSRRKNIIRLSQCYWSNFSLHEKCVAIKIFCQNKAEYKDDCVYFIKFCEIVKA